MMAPPLLDISDASVIRGDRLALDSLSIRIEQGQHTAILGPNGSGKSTLIAMLSRQLYPVYGGRVSVLGSDRILIADMRKLIGIISPAVHQDLTGDDGGRLRVFAAVAASFFGARGLWDRQPDAEMRRRTYEALEASGAGDLAEREMRTLSSGEARRVLIARALVHRPKALMLDEPCQGLDPGTRRRFLEDLQALGSNGTTLIMVTHHIEEILPEMSQLILLKEGKLLASGPKEELLTGPTLSALFDAQVKVECDRGWYWPRFTPAL